jgi:hypothetical protein
VEHDKKMEQKCPVMADEGTGQEEHEIEETCWLEVVEGNSVRKWT